jgi:hypothetical protein
MCHHPPGLVYSSDPPAEGWCFFNDLAGCAENNDEITMDPIVWFVCAAFEDPAEWCGTEFGVTYTPYSWIPLEYDVCAPGGFLTIPTPAWPGPDQGISIATTDTPWTGNFEEVYWFGGYGYYGGVWCLIDNPGSPGTVGFSNCAQVEFAAGCFGCIGFGAGNFGYDCCPAPPPPTGACCFPDGTCQVLEIDDCTGQGGIYQGDDVPCNPCPQPGACCLDNDVCIFVLADECAAQSGDFLGEGIGCGPPNPCEPPPVYGACCYPDGLCEVVESGTCTGVYLGDDTDCGPPNPCPQPAACCIDHTCYFVLFDECEAMMGVWMGEGTTCAPDNPCDIFTPADPSSWGTIKAIYR